MKVVNFSVMILTILLAFSACKNDEGCTDPVALTYDSKASKSDQSQCKYSSVTFYASSNTHTGIEVNKIIITINSANDTIGSITTFNQAYPNGCNDNGYLKYTLTTSTPLVWSASFYLDNGGLVHDQGTVQADRNQECIIVNVLP